MDDIIRSIKRNKIGGLLSKCNVLHKNLKFTMEESDAELPSLDMKISRMDGRLTCAWFRKATDTELCLASYSCAPTRYKKNTVIGIFITKNQHEHTNKTPNTKQTTNVG